MQKLQFRVLYRVFLRKTVDFELLSADADTSKLLGQIAALLAAISFLFCLPLLLCNGRLQEDQQWFFEHLFIKTTMLVAGLFSVLNLDSIFPDKRDALVLGPLPVLPRTVFLAKVAAAGSALAGAVVSVNILTGALWPLFFSNGSLASVLRTYLAYWVSMACAASFMFFSVLAVQGLAPQFLPRQLFLHVSSALQIVCVCLFLVSFFVVPTSVDADFLRAQFSHWQPSLWFFGLFQQYKGADPTIAQDSLALTGRAFFAFAVSASAAVVTLLFSYLRTMRKVVESPDIASAGHGIRFPLPFRSSISSAIFLFCIRTLPRSRHHRVIFSFYLGIGFAAVLAYMRTSFFAGERSHEGSSLVNPHALAASILMMCIALGALRVVYSIPAELRANWIFRMTESHPHFNYQGAVRKVFYGMGFLPVWITSAAFFLSAWPWLLAVEHLVMLALVGMILVEAFLLGFNKLPFSCSYLPGKGNLQYVFWVCAFLVLPMVSAAAQFEMQVLYQPIAYSATIVILGALLSCNRWYSSARLHTVTPLKFDESDSAETLSLSLNRN